MLDEPIVTLNIEATGPIASGKSRAIGRILAALDRDFKVEYERPKEELERETIRICLSLRR